MQFIGGRELSYLPFVGGSMVITGAVLGIVGVISPLLSTPLFVGGLVLLTIYVMVFTGTPIMKSW